MEQEKRGKVVSCSIYCEDYSKTVERLYRAGKHVDVVLTSPPYNTNKKQGHSRTLLDVSTSSKYSWVRYDTVQDNMTNDEYCEFLTKFMIDMNAILAERGVVLVNLSYGNENPDGIWRAVSAVIENTDFTVADCIVWRKRNAMPNNCSQNRLTRICEFVFVFVRKQELLTFHANKPVRSVRKTGQKSFGSIPNLIEAANNDGPCPFNKATFSSDLVNKLLAIYAPAGALVYDPFMGSGTTLVACDRLGYDSIGSEISELQCIWARQRVGLVCGGAIQEKEGALE